MEKRKTLVIGAGNVGPAVAGYLTLAGYEVTLYEIPWLGQNLEPFVRCGGVKLLGAGFNDFAKLSRITTDIAEAVNDVPVLLVATTAMAHETVAHLCATHLQNGQTIVLIPGNLGSLIFSKVLRELRVDTQVKIAETSTAPFGCRRIAGEAKVSIAISHQMRIAALPATKTEEVIDDVKGLFSDPFLCAKNVLEVAFDNPNYQHVPLAILNTGWIEFSGGAFSFYKDGLTPSVLNVVEAVSRERSSVCKALGLSEYKLFNRERTKSRLDSPHIAGLAGPTDMQHRFITEDCAIGLVSMTCLGEIAGVPMPICKALVTLASEINRVDYLTEGRNTERLGISGLSVHALLKLVNEGPLQIHQ